jgi:hypothetical protein
MWGPTIPELVEALSGVQIMDRSSVNVFDDPGVASAIEATGRRKLIFAGLSLEVCAAFPAITAVSRGLDPYVAVDACGTFSETKRQVGLLRMSQAGVILSDYATLMVEILKDNGRPEAGAVYGAMDMDWAKLVGQMAQAHANKRCTDRFKQLDWLYLPNVRLWPSLCENAKIWKVARMIFLKSSKTGQACESLRP